MAERLSPGPFLEKISKGARIFCTNGPLGVIETIASETFTIKLTITDLGFNVVPYELNKENKFFQIKTGRNCVLISVAPNRDVCVIHP